MGKLRKYSGKDLCSLLERNGFVAVRQRGSHRIMQKREEGSTVTVPVPLHRELRTGTLRAIIRQSGLDRSLFES